jgi:2-polyprenyl-6-hydroxyphenyl methylase/3-demethylubiquinone-9 3-methyltransferase
MSALAATCSRSRPSNSARSFDYDPDSVESTRLLKQRFAPEQSYWMTEQGSVLDVDFLGSLHRFDVVFAWGVLHHTGDMWTAIDNVTDLVKPLSDSGSTYNDQGEVTGLEVG